MDINSIKHWNSKFKFKIDGINLIFHWRSNSFKLAAKLTWLTQTQAQKSKLNEEEIRKSLASLRRQGSGRRTAESYAASPRLMTGLLVVSLALSQYEMLATLQTKMASFLSQPDDPQVHKFSLFKFCKSKRPTWLAWFGLVKYTLQKVKRQTLLILLQSKITRTRNYATRVNKVITRAF